MAITVGLASDYLNLFQRLRKYLTGNMSVENEISNPANVGDGFIRWLLPQGGSTIQSWTLTCTTAGGDGVGIFSVVGSVSGTLAPATVGTFWNPSEIEFEIREGATPYSVGDEFTFDVIANDIPVGQQWTELKYSPGVETVPGANNNMNVDPGAGDLYANELYLKGPGLAAADNVHVNMYTVYDESGDWYNLGFMGATGFETLDNFDNQPGVSPVNGMMAWQFQIPYWIVADGRRFIITFKVSTSYMNGYFGLILPYATPTEYPYPLYIGGGYTTPNLRWSNESNNHRSFFDPYAGYMYTIEGTWLLIQNKYDSNGNEIAPTVSNIWPHGGNTVSNVRQSPGDVYPMLPMVMHSSSNGGNVLGELSGCFWCPGFANASENTIVVDAINYTVFQDVYRTGNIDYYALKME